MSTQWDKTCLVCCAKTENRCSSCAKAGIDLFFCSPDHQKLVWKAHRRVCGPGKANPFTWPLLSQLEADEIIEHMHESTGIFADPGAGAKSVAGAMHACEGFKPEELPAFIHGLTVDLSTFPEAVTSAQQLFLGTIRAYEVMRQATTPADVKRVIVSCRDPMAALALDEVSTARPDSVNLEPWRTKYRHFVLVQFALLDLWDRTAGQAPSVEWLVRIVERLNDFVSTEVEPLHPRVAAKLFSAMPSSETLADRLALYGGRAA
ncbi:hypothetical protein JCM8208_002832 [Rhodotorula glutinis]